MSFSMNRMGGLSGFNVGFVIPFSGPEQVNDPFWQNVVLYTRMEANPPIDLSISAHTFTDVGAAGLDTTNFRFGAGAGDFDGTDTSRFRSVDSSDWDFGDQPFTVECWCRPDTISVAQRVLSLYGDGGSNDKAWFLGFGSGNNASFTYSTDGSADTVLNTSGFTLVVNQWIHIVAQRDEVNDLRIFVNGEQVAVANMGSDSIFNPSIQFNISGRENATEEAFNGQIDEVRITKGIARYG